MVDVDKDIKRRQRETLLRKANDAWSAMQADPELRREFEDEDAAWEATLLDGLEDEEW